jgi:thymidylate synthase (FAD)
MADDDMIVEYLNRIGASQYGENHHAFDEAHDLVEFAGRMCYRSWQPGLNPNVTKVRAAQGPYLENIIKSGHGSVLEHVSWTFLLEDISRVLTHELVRHRAGVAISQESMRYVRLDELPFWFPEWAREDPELMDQAMSLLRQMENFQLWMASHFKLDEAETGFGTKKAKTSFMRRFAPSGHATSMTWTVNARALRHIIEARTAAGAEEEIRLVFQAVALLMTQQCPLLFGDFTQQEDGSWKPKWSKV